MDLTTGMAALGTFGFLADTALALRNARRIKALERQVAASIERAELRGQLIDQSAQAVEAVARRAGLVRDESGAWVEAAQSPGFAHGLADPKEARQVREDKALAFAEAEERIRAGFVKQLGEELGEAAFSTAKRNADAFKKAVRAVASGKVEQAQRILAPSAERFSVGVQESAAPVRRASSASSGGLPSGS